MPAYNLPDQLAKHPEQFLYDRVAALIRQMIDEGTLGPGERIPSLRALSARLQISLATVMQAYMQLEQEGVVQARPQSGFYVRNRPGDMLSTPTRETPKTIPRRIRRADFVESIFANMREPGMIPLGLADPATELLPLHALNRTLRKIIATQPHTIIAYAKPEGHYALRKQIAMRSPASGCAMTPEEIIITHGATEALAIALRSIASPGDIIAVESPTYFNVLQIIESLGLLALEICSCPENGLCLDELTHAIKKTCIKAVISVANFNNPTGSLMPAEDKRALVELLAKHNIPLLEDDINGDLYYGDKRPCIAKCFDSKGLVLHFSSFSKTLAPGYRIGWLNAGSFHNLALRQKFISSSSTVSLQQLTIAEFLRQGGYDRHLKRLRSAYRTQVETMRALVAQRFPEGTLVTRPQGGFVLWIKLPGQIDSNLFYQRALEHNISVAPGSIFSSTEKYKHYIRLSCGHPVDKKIEQAVQTLGELCKQLLA